MKRQRLAARLIFGKTGARLDRERGLAVHAEAAFDAHRRGLRIAASTSPRLNSRLTSTLVPASSCSSGAPERAAASGSLTAASGSIVDVDQFERRPRRDSGSRR